MTNEQLKLGFLNVENTALFICDIQEKFSTVIKYFDNVVNNSAKVISGCKLMNIPIVVSEQYPKGLGKTVSALNIEGSHLFAKTAFNMIVPEVEDLLNTLNDGKLKSIVLLGMEAHVCIEETAIDLVSRGYTVHVVADCCSSRSQEDRLLAFQRLQQIGCFVTTSESVLFKLLKSKDNPKFKEMTALVKQLSEPTNLVPDSHL